jgi:hypothetical protein
MGGRVSSGTVQGVLNFYSSDNMEEMQCQLQISRDTLLMGGHQEKVIEFNLNQGQETNLVCTFLTVLRF